jgi:hypothetical protein
MRPLYKQTHLRVVPVLYAIKDNNGKHEMSPRQVAGMEIERLSFLITPKDKVDEFIEADTAVWEPWLQQQKGYLRKHYQRYPTGRVDIRIFWDSKKNLDAASKSPEIPALDVKLQAAFLGVFQRL